MRVHIRDAAIVFDLYHPSKRWHYISRFAYMQDDWLYDDKWTFSSRLVPR